MVQNYTEGKNIAKLLKYAPKGTMLYSPLIGSCTLVRVSDDRIIVSNLEDTQHYGFDRFGRYWTGMGECVLYPSRDHRVWDGWQNVLFSKGDVVVREGVGTYIIVNEFDSIDMYDNILIDKDGTRYANLMCDGTPLFTECRYASPQEARAFMTVLERKGYRWDDQKKEMVLCKPKDEAPKHKYDIAAGRWYVAKSTQYFGDTYLAFTKGFVYRSDADGYVTDSHGQSMFIGNCGEYFQPAPADRIPNARTANKSGSDLKPFDKVICRRMCDAHLTYSGDVWRIDLFSKYHDGWSLPYHCMTDKYDQCVPYNNETEKLIGTRDDYTGIYRTWL